MGEKFLEGNELGADLVGMSRPEINAGMGTDFVVGNEEGNQGEEVPRHKKGKNKKKVGLIAPRLSQLPNSLLDSKGKSAELGQRSEAKENSNPFSNQIKNGVGHYEELKMGKPSGGNTGLLFSFNPSTTLHQVQTLLNQQRHAVVQIAKQGGGNMVDNPINGKSSVMTSSSIRNQITSRPPDKRLSGIRVNKASC